MRKTYRALWVPFPLGPNAVLTPAARVRVFLPLLAKLAPFIRKRLLPRQLTRFPFLK